MELPRDTILWENRQDPPDTAFVRVFYENDSYRQPILTCDIDWSLESKEQIISYMPLKDWQIVEAGHAILPALFNNQFITPNTRLVS